VRLWLFAVVACSSPPGERTTTPVVTPPVDAAVALDAPSDAGPSPEVAAAPEWVFRFNAGARFETWRLRFADSGAALVIERKDQPTLSHLGTASGTKFKFAEARLELDCKRDKLDVVGAKAVRACQGKQPGRWAPATTTKLDVLSCKLAGFDVPMPFAAAPGVEYVQINDDCGGGYRAIAAP
jgi:hypothetical protein